VNLTKVLAELKRRNVEILAAVEVLVGDKTRALPKLQRFLEIPYADCLTPSLLRLQPTMGSSPQRSSVPKTLRGKAFVNVTGLFSQLKRTNIS
jgi:hypothetical protein